MNNPLSMGVVQCLADLLDKDRPLIGRNPYRYDRMDLDGAQELARLIKEIDQKLAGRMVRHADLGGLPYSRMVIDETMRLYPPVAAIWRQVKVDIEVTGSTIPQGPGLLVAPFMTHRHPDFWPDHWVFDPERFNPETAPKRHPFAYFPFGGGRHLCLGKHFALLESQVILITVLQYYRLRLMDTRTAVPHFCITLRPKDGLHCVVERR